MCALHHCDNPPCVNLKHLWKGTPADNSRDRDQKERGCQIAGEQSSSAKLTVLQVHEIREHYAAGSTSCRRLGADYSMSASQICRIINGKTWKGVS